MKKINIIVPIYNEEESLPFLKSRLVNVIKNIKKYRFEILLVNDGSTDGSLEIAEKIRKSDNRFSVLNLSRNFGKEIAMIAGMDYSKQSDAVIIIDADLQDPPELIPKLIYYWEKGYDDVYAKRKSRDGETCLKKITSKIYYSVLQKFTKVPIQKDTGDFRLLDKRCINAICNMRENARCSKSIFSWIGYNKKEVLYDREKRIAGKTKWNYKKLVGLAIDGITSLSISPLKWAAILSIPIILICMAYFVYIIINFITKSYIETNQLIILLILFFGAAQITLIGIIGEYLGRIFNETKQRPLYLVDTFNGKREINEENINGTEKEAYSNYTNIDNISTGNN